MWELTRSTTIRWSRVRPLLRSSTDRCLRRSISREAASMGWVTPSRRVLSFPRPPIGSWFAIGRRLSSPMVLVFESSMNLPVLWTTGVNVCRWSVGRPPMR